VRERVRELAMLKAIGFSDVFVLATVLSESLLIAMVGAILGLGLAKFLSLGGDVTGGFLPLFYLPGAAVVLGIFLAIAVGIVAGLPPGMNAMRLKVVDALRRV